MFNNIINSITDKVEDFIDDPIGTTVGTVTQPVRDGLDLLEGLTEGEIRTMAAARLGADYVTGLALGEVVEALLESLE